MQQREFEMVGFARLAEEVAGEGGRVPPLVFGIGAFLLLALLLFLVMRMNINR